MRERWGAMSVRDHVSSAPYVTEVLLYDRLIIPVPATAENEESNWEREWQPELLGQCLDILKIKTERKDGLALTVPWDGSKRERFRNRMSMASALAVQHRDPSRNYYMDPFQMTRQLLKDEFKPALPPGVSQAWAIAAYSSTEAFRNEINSSTGNRETKLALSVAHRFLTPARSDPKHELLKRAVDLSTTDDFRRKRARFYEWQEGIIQDQITDEKAIEELETLLLAYNEATRKAFRNVVVRYAFTVIPIGLAMAGALMGGSKTGLEIASASGLVQLARFWTFDRKPAIADGDLDAAAMVHDARKTLSLN
jgi:hypothetical protein